MRLRVATIASAALKPFGLDIVHRSTVAVHATPPPLRRSPIEALVASREGEPGTFLCPVDGIVMLNGFGFGPHAWHPFSAVLRQYSRGTVSCYEDSVLAAFYAEWTPAQASEAVLGFTDGPSCLVGVPAHGFYFTPWSSRGLPQVLSLVEQYYAADYREHGAPDLRIDVDGFKYHGPVSVKLGRLEFDRLARIYASLASRQYDRGMGDVNVYAIRRRGELRFVCFGGVHRVAAMSAIGHDAVPARLCAPYLVDVEELEGWPQVVNGAWASAAAKRYFDHLFDFGSLEWARAMGWEIPASSTDRLEVVT